MKKLLSFLFVFLCISANAQWTVHEKKGDELLGTEDSIAYLYHSSDGSFVCWNNADYVKINLDSGIFNYETYYGSGYVLKYFSALVGFYNRDGSLAEKAYCRFECDDNDVDRAFSSDQEISLKIIKWLMSGRGKIRIVVQKYTGGNFDISVPANTAIKNSIVGKTGLIESSMI